MNESFATLNTNSHVKVHYLDVSGFPWAFSNRGDRRGGGRRGERRNFQLCKEHVRKRRITFFTNFRFSSFPENIFIPQTKGGRRGDFSATGQTGFLGVGF